MSTVVDKRIVEMDFDNSDFESGVKTSLNTLDRLKRALIGLPSLAGNGISGIGDSMFNNLTNSFQNVAYNVEGIFAKVGNTILTDTVLQWKRAFENIIEDASLRQISAGWNKYAEKTTAVQTIMAATKREGESEEAAMARVNEQLEKLMWFSDETSYSFNDMVSNIGKFTSQGVELDVATNAMMGISNWAAVSGANVQQASHAMYNLSQALALGSVRLQDWRSIETANMSTKEFKEMVIQTALEMGTLEKVMEDGEEKIYAVGETGKRTAINFQSMTNSLTEGLNNGVKGWFTNDVLTTVLNRYSTFAEAVYEISDQYDTANEAIASMDLSQFDELAVKAFLAAQEAKTFQEAIDSVKDAVSSQWSSIFEKLFGDYLNAKVVWTQLANGLWDIFAEPVSLLNQILKLWTEWDLMGDKLTGQFYFVESLKSGFEGLVELFGIFRDGYRENVGTVDDLARSLINSSMKAYETVSFVVGFIEEHSEQLTNIIRGLTSPLRLITKVISIFFTTLDKEVNKSSIRLASEDMLTFVESITDYIDSVVTAIEQSDIFVNVFTALFKALKQGYKFVKDFVNGFINSSAFNTIVTNVEAIGTTIWKFFETIAESLNGITSENGLLKDILNVLKEFGSLATGPLSWFANILFDIFTIIGNFFGTKWQEISSALSNVPGIIEKVIDKIKDFGKSFSFIFDGITNLFDSFAGANNENLLGNFLGNIFNFILDKIEGFDLNEAAENISDMFEDVGEIIQATLEFFGIDELSGADLAKIISNITNLSIILTKFVKWLFTVKPALDIVTHITKSADNITKAIDTFIKLPDKILKFMETWSKIPATFAKEILAPVKILALVPVIRAIGTVALEFAAAFLIMSLIPTDRMAQVSLFTTEMFIVIEAVLITITQMLKKLNKQVFSTDSLQSIVKIVGVFNAISHLLVGIGAMMLMFAISASIFSKAEHGVKATIEILTIVAGMFGALFALKKMDYTMDDATSVYVLAAALTVLGLGLIEIAAAALILDQVQANGLAALAGVVVILGGIFGILTAVMQFSGFDTGDAAAIFILSGSIVALGFAVGELAVAAMLFNHAGDGFGPMIATLMSLAGVVGILGIVATKLSPASIGPILALGAMMGGIAVSIVAFATACLIFNYVQPDSLKQAAIALGILAGAVAILGLVALALSNTGPAAIGVIAGFIGLFVSIAALIGAVGLSIWLVVKGIQGFVDAFQTLSEMDISQEQIMQFIDNFAEILKGFGSAFVDAGWEIMGKLIEGLTNYLATNATSIFTLAVTIMDILANGIIQLGPKILEALTNIIKVFMLLTPALSMLFISLRVIATSFFTQLLIMLANWITQSLDMLEYHAEDWGNRAALIVTKFYIGFVKGMDQMSQDIVEVTFKFILGFIQDLIDALGVYGPQLKQKGVELFKEFMEMMFEGEDALGQITTSVTSAAWNIIQGLVDGLTNFKALDVLGGAAITLGQTLINKFMESTQEHSPSKVFEKLGGFIPEGVAIGIKDKTDQAVGAMKDSADSLLSPMKDSITSLFTDLNGEDMNPVISPILDLSNVDEGMGDLSSYFNSDNFNLSGSYSAKASSASSSGFSSGSSSDLNNMFASLMDKLNTNSSQFKGMAETPVNVNVMLEGDTKKIFNVVQKENSKFKLATGHSGF